MSSITSLVANFSGNVSYLNGSVESFAAQIDADGNVSLNDGDNSSIYAVIVESERLSRLATLLFGDRADMEFFVSPSPLSAIYPPVGSYHIKVDVYLTFDDGTSDNVTAYDHAQEGFAISDNFQEVMDKVILDETIGGQFDIVLDYIFGQGICTVSRNDDPPFAGDNVLPE